MRRVLFVITIAISNLVTAIIFGSSADSKIDSGSADSFVEIVAYHIPINRDTVTEAKAFRTADGWSALVVKLKQKYTDGFNKTIHEINHPRLTSVISGEVINRNIVIGFLEDDKFDFTDLGMMIGPMSERQLSKAIEALGY